MAVWVSALMAGSAVGCGAYVVKRVQVRAETRQAVKFALITMVGVVYAYYWANLARAVHAALRPHGRIVRAALAYFHAAFLDAGAAFNSRGRMLQAIEPVAPYFFVLRFLAVSLAPLALILALRRPVGSALKAPKPWRSWFRSGNSSVDKIDMMISLLNDVKHELTTNTNVLRNTDYRLRRIVASADGYSEEPALEPAAVATVPAPKAPAKASAAPVDAPVNGLTDKEKQLAQLSIRELIIYWNKKNGRPILPFHRIELGRLTAQEVELPREAVNEIIQTRRSRYKLAMFESQGIKAHLCPACRWCIRDDDDKHKCKVDSNFRDFVPTSAPVELCYQTINDMKKQLDAQFDPVVAVQYEKEKARAGAEESKSESEQPTAAQGSSEDRKAELNGLLTQLIGLLNQPETEAKVRRFRS